MASDEGNDDEGKGSERRALRRERTHVLSLVVSHGWLMR